MDSKEATSSPISFPSTEKIDTSIASDDGGFESGQEDFEQDEKPREKGVKEEISADPVNNVAEVNNVEVLVDEEVVDVGNNGSVDDVHLEKGISDGNSGDPFVGSVETSTDKIDDEDEKVVDGDKESGVLGSVETETENSDLNSNVKVEEKGVESSLEEGEKNADVGLVSEKMEVVEEKKNENLDDGVVSLVSEEMEVKGEETEATVQLEGSEKIEESAEKVVESESIEGDSVVEAIDVELVEPGVAVIEEEDKVEENVESKEVENVPVNESDGEDEFTQLIDELNKSRDDEVLDGLLTSDSAVDANVETSESKPVLEDDFFDATLESDNVEVKPEMEIETKENGTLENIETSQVDDSVDDSVDKKVSDESPELEILEAEDEVKNQIDEEEGNFEGLDEEETDGMVFGNSAAAKQFIEELERGSVAETDNSERIDGQIVTDSEEEGETDEEEEEEEEENGRELFDSAALAALLKAATGGDPEGNLTITSEDGSRLFSLERPAGLGSSMRSLRPNPRSNRTNLFTPTSLLGNTQSDNNLSEEDKTKLTKLQQIRVKYLRIIQRLGVSTDENIVSQVLYRLANIAGKQSDTLFNMEEAKRTALNLEEEGKEDLDFSINMVVIGKCGVGKSATINSLFGEEKVNIDAFEASTTNVKEIFGIVDGVKLRVFDSPGLKPSVMEQAFNRNVLSSVMKLTKKKPADIILYVDRLDAPTRDLNDLPLLKTISSSLGSSAWRNVIVTLTHAASAPPDGLSGSPLSYEGFVTQRSHVVQQSIGKAVGDMRMMSPSLMNPVSLVENHISCRKNRDGQKVLPNGQSWRPQLLLLCYSMKILSEASLLSKPQDPFDHRKLFGFRARAPPLPYMLSSMLQSRPHPKQGGDNVDSDIDLDDFSDTDQEEDEYDQLPSFKPLKKAQFAKLSNEQKKAYYEEYDYRVKLLQKKQWRDELKRMKEIKKRGKDGVIEFNYPEEDSDSGSAAPVSVPLPDMSIPPSFDSDYPAHRYRFLEPTSQFLARPVLDTHGWDHDCGYDGVNFEHSLALASQFPANYTIQVTKDKKDFTINMDSAVSVKHGENGSSMAGFDIQAIGKQLAYIVRGETKFKNFKKNKTSAGFSVTKLGENIVPGIRIEDQVMIGKQYVITGSAGVVKSQQDIAYGGNFELIRREEDYPIGQVQSTLSMSIIKWRGDLALGFNGLTQFSIGRNSKVAVRAGINNKMSGQITVRTSSSDHLSLALAAIIPTALGIYRKIWPVDVSDKYSIY